MLSEFIERPSLLCVETCRVDHIAACLFLVIIIHHLYLLNNRLAFP